MAVIDTSESGRQAKSFLASLFNLSFTSFITLKLITVLYAISMVLAALAALAMVFSAFNINTNLGVLALLLSPLVFILVLMGSRVSLELVAIFFRIEENTSRLVSPAQVHTGPVHYQAPAATSAGILH